MRANTYFHGDFLLFTKKTLMENFIFGGVVFVNFIDHQFEQFVSRTFLGTTNVFSRVKNACFSKRICSFNIFVNECKIQTTKDFTFRMIFQLN